MRVYTNFLILSPSPAGQEEPPFPEDRRGPRPTCEYFPDHQQVLGVFRS